MAITTYADLQAAIADWLDRADLTLRIKDFIALAEAQMNRGLRVRRMVSRSTASVDGGFAELPSDYLQAIALRLDGERLAPAPPEVIADYRSASDSPGKPRVFAIVGGELQFFPSPDRAYDVELTYHAKIPALSVSNPSNWVLAEAPDAYLYGALLQAAPYLRDNEAAQVWNAGFTAALDGLRMADRTPAGLLRVEPSLREQRAYSVTTDL